MSSSSSVPSTSSSSSTATTTTSDEPSHKHDRIHSVCLHPSLQLVALGCESRVRLWSLKANIKLKDIVHSGSVLSVEFDPDGRFLATAGSHDIGVNLDLTDQTDVKEKEKNEKERKGKKTIGGIYTIKIWALWKGEFKEDKVQELLAPVLLADDSQLFYQDIYHVVTKKKNCSSS